MDSLYNFFLHLCCRSEYTKLREDDEENNSLKSGASFRPKVFPQYLAALTASIGAFALGNTLGWSSPALPNIEIRGDFNNLKANSELATWIGAMTPLGCIFSGFVAGYLIQRIGRKWTMLATSPLFLVGWLIVAFAPTATWILVGRFVTGFCGGSFTLTVPVYSSEIAQDNIRGIVANCMGIGIGAGILLVYIAGSFVSWSTLSIICSVVPVIFAIGMIFMPETPLYLLVKGKHAEARQSLMWLRGAKYESEIEEELKSIEASIDKSEETTKLRDLFTRSVLKPLCISLMLMLFQQLGGINGVTFYVVDIFRDAGTDLDANLSGIIVGTVILASMCSSSLVVDRIGRKTLLAVCEFGMTISLVGLGVFFYLKDSDPEQVVRLGWLPLTSLMMYVFAFNFGVGNLPWTMMGELLPPKGKGLTSSIATAFNWFLGFLITKFFKNMLTALTAYGCYWLFAAVSFVGMLYCLIFVPETRGKSLLEIQEYFK